MGNRIIKSPQEAEECPDPREEDEATLEREIQGK